nr:MAG TPA: hypothetical protein [Bacteriophage sp.]
MEKEVYSNEEFKFAGKVDHHYGNYRNSNINHSWYMQSF